MLVTVIKPKHKSGILALWQTRDIYELFVILVVEAIPGRPDQYVPDC